MTPNTVDRFDTDHQRWERQRRNQKRAIVACLVLAAALIAFLVS